MRKVDFRGETGRVTSCHFKRGCNLDQQEAVLHQQFALSLFWLDSESAAAELTAHCGYHG
jgi:hypothetical protein